MKFQLDSSKPRIFPSTSSPSTGWKFSFVVWSTPLGTMDANAPVADGVLVDLNLWGTTIIGLTVQCPDGIYFSSIRAPRNLYEQTFPLFGTTSLAAGDAADIEKGLIAREEFM